MAEFIDFLIEEAFISITLLVLIILLIANFIMDANKKYADISTTQAIDLMDDKDLIVLDVREAKERVGGFIKNDTHIPMAQVKNKLDTLNKDNKVLVYCRSGNRSSHICGTLVKGGFEKIYNLKGGFVAWQKANLPIAKK
jgi:rhodanese-related sulfurtransferase